MNTATLSRSEFLPPSASPARDNPFVGPVPFTENEAVYFFGRDFEARELTALLSAERVVLLYSPSGAGKTSLIQARLIPSLRKQRFEVLPIIRVGREAPGEVQAPVNRYLLSTLRSLGWLGDASGSLPNLRAFLDGGLMDDEAAKGRVLIIDQLEELFNQNPADLADKQEFFRELGQVLDTEHDSSDGRPRRLPYWALLVTREKYLGALDPYLPLLPVRPTQFRMNLLDEKKTIAAIQGPASKAGGSVGDEAARWVFRSLARRHVMRPDKQEVESIESPVIDPVHLQVACQQIWEELPPGKREISLATLQPRSDQSGLDRIDVALTGYYQRAVAGAATRGGVPEREVRLWIEQHLINRYGLRGMFTPDPLNPGLAPAAIAGLVESGVVQSDERNGVSWLELSHDRLVRPVKGDNDSWFEQNLRWHQLAAVSWEKAPDSEKPRLLLGGLSLLRAEAWVRTHPEEGTDRDRAFLGASRHQWLRARQKWALVIAVGLLLLLTGFLALQRQQKRAIEANSFAARAQLAIQTDTETALLYAIAALTLQGKTNSDFLDQAEQDPNPAARDAAKQVLAQAAGRALIKHTGPISKVDLSGKWVITASSDGKVMLWDIKAITGQNKLPQPAVLNGEKGHTKAVMWTAFNSKNDRLATVSVDRRLCVWDLTKAVPGQELDPVWDSRPVGNTLSRVEFFTAPGPKDETTEWLCAAGQDGNVYFWLDRSSGQKPAAHPEFTATNAHQGRVTAIVPPVDATAWLVTGGGADIRFWRISDVVGRIKKGDSKSEANEVSCVAMKAHLGGVTDISTFRMALPGGSAERWLASVGNDRTLRIWRMAGLPGSVSGGSDPCAIGSWRHVEEFSHSIVDIAVRAPGAEMNPRRDLLICGDSDGRLSGWDLSELLEQLGRLKDPVVEKKNTRGQIRFETLDSDPARQPKVKTSTPSEITDIDISNDGTWVTSSAADGTVDLYKAVGSGWNRRAIRLGHGVRSISFGEESSELFLITGGEDEVARVWNVKKEKEFDREIEALHLDPANRLAVRAALFNEHTNGQLLKRCKEIAEQRLGPEGVKQHFEELTGLRLE